MSVIDQRTDPDISDECLSVLIVTENAFCTETWGWIDWDCHWECLAYWDPGLTRPEIVIENALRTQTWVWTDPRLSLRRSCLLRPGLNRPEIIIENVLCTQAVEPTQNCHWERLVFTQTWGWTDPWLSLRMSCVLSAGIITQSMGAIGTK